MMSAIPNVVVHDAIQHLAPIWNLANSNVQREATYAVVRAYTNRTDLGYEIERLELEYEVLLAARDLIVQDMVREAHGTDAAANIIAAKNKASTLVRFLKAALASFE